MTDQRTTADPATYDSQPATADGGEAMPHDGTQAAATAAAPQASTADLASGPTQDTEAIASAAPRSALTGERRRRP